MAGGSAAGVQVARRAADNAKLNHGLRSLGAGRLLRRPPSVTVGEGDFRFSIGDFRFRGLRPRLTDNRKSKIENQKSTLLLN